MELPDALVVTPEMEKTQSDLFARMVQLRDELLLLLVLLEFRFDNTIGTTIAITMTTMKAAPMAIKILRSIKLE